MVENANFRAMNPSKLFVLPFRRGRLIRVLMHWAAALLPLAVHAADNTTVARLTVQNPQMTDGTEKPEGWTQVWTGSGKASVRRDTATFHSAPASLTIEAQGGATQTHVSQMFEVSGGETLGVCGWLRAADGGNAMLAVQSFSASWQGLDLKVLGNNVAGFDWKKVCGEVKLPADARHAAIVLMLQGTGQAWLDDVSADGSDPGANATPQNAVTPAKPKPQGPPKAKHACDPAEGFYPDYPEAWRKVVEGQLKRAKEGPAPVVFLGDSLTQGWGEQAHWKDHYAKLGAVNFGVGGDGTPQVLWRIDKGILDGLDPKVIVLCLGVNNVWPGFGAEDTVKGLEAIIARAKAKCPHAKFLLLGNTHYFDKGDGKSRQRVRTIDAALAKMADGNSIRYVEFAEKLLAGNDELNPDMYKGDKLHFTDKAYEVWSQTMDPVLDAMLK